MKLDPEVIRVGWELILGGIGVVLWFARLEAKVLSQANEIKDLREKETKIWEKFDSLTESIAEVKLGIARIEVKLENQKQPPQ